MNYQIFTFTFTLLYNLPHGNKSLELENILSMLYYTVDLLNLQKLTYLLPSFIYLVSGNNHEFLKQPIV